MRLKFSGAAGGLFTPLNSIARKRPLPAAPGTEAQRHGVEKRTEIHKLVYVTVSATALLLLFFLALRYSPYADLKAFLERPYSVRYYDRNGLLLQITPLAEGLRREKPLEVPGEIKDVFVFAEDRRFYSHFGVDGLALIRAISQNLSGGRRVSGASTITMQLARLVSASKLQNISQSASQNASPVASPRSGLGRKIMEALNALRLEARLSKNEILELYLNSLPFGFNAEGVASAGRTFFSSELSMLSPAQIFCLAIIPRRPGFYNPLENPESCIIAAKELQERFSKNKKLKNIWPLLTEIGGDDWSYAAASARRFFYPFELPHLIRHISTLNGEQGGAKNGIISASSEIIPQGEIHLSIDLRLQHFLEAAIAGNVSRYYSSRLTNGAALVIDNKSGEILAWVGSADYNNADAAGQIDGVLALNQPGSSMKPFLYAMALEKGFKPTDVMADIPMNFGEAELYLPRNFNNRFNGPMLFRAALASSLNIPAVYLLYRLGVQNYANQLLSLGFNSIEESAESAGLGLALGNAPVSLEELVRAFSVFPRDGVYIPLTWEIVPGLNGNTGQNRTGPGSSQPEKFFSDRIYSEDTARLICSFLSDAGARVLAFGSARNFRTRFQSIFKTGTANQYQSIVALGATPKYTAGVWMGNFTGETVIGKTGSSIPAAIVRDALVFLQGNDSPGFPLPVEWHLQRVCAVSGMKPTEACLSVISEYIQNGEENSPCTWHRIVNGRSEVRYPAEYQAWFSPATRQGSLDYGSSPLEIVSPREGFVYLTSPGIGRDEIPVDVIGGSEDELRVIYDDRRFIVRRPFVFYLEKTPGYHILRVQNGDEEEEITFTVER